MTTSPLRIAADELRALAERLYELDDAGETSHAIAEREIAAVAEFLPRRKASLQNHRLLATAKMMRRARRGRAEFFGAEMFADPSWDLLLELFIAELSGERRSTGTLCLAANTASGTTVRYLRYLENAGLAAPLEKDGSDLLPTHGLTAKGFQLMRGYIEKHCSDRQAVTPEILTMCG